MEMFGDMLYGFSITLTFGNIFYCFAGVVIGTLVGVLPGLGPVAAISLLFPATLHIPPVSAIIMLAGIYYGAQYGGSTTSILVNIPGEATSVVTTLDGHQRARQGRAGPALALAGRLVRRRLGRVGAGDGGRSVVDRPRPVVRPGRIFLAHGARPDLLGG